MREKIQWEILAKSFIIDDLYVQQQERIEKEEKYILRALPNGYIYGFNLLNIASKDLNLPDII